MPRILLGLLLLQGGPPKLAVTAPEGYRCTAYLTVERTDSLVYQVDCGRLPLSGSVGAK